MRRNEARARKGAALKRKTQKLSAGLYTDSRAIAINGFGAGQTNKLGVRAIGGSTGYSDWSDSGEHMSM
jgi:hypothetical protein